MPESVLLGVSYLQSRWDTNAGTPSTSGGYGPMHLTDAEHVAALPGARHHDEGTEDPRGDDSRPSLAAAAEPAEPPRRPPPRCRPSTPPPTLTGASEEALRTDATANIRGGAALLAAYQKEIGRAGRRRAPTRRPGTARWPATPARTAPTPRRPSPTRCTPPSRDGRQPG